MKGERKRESEMREGERRFREREIEGGREKDMYIYI